MVDGFSARYGDLLYGSYDCVARIVLNAYHTLCYQPGGFRTWWRRLHGDDEQLDNAHLMRMAGRFARRVRASAAAHGIPVIDCKRGERKHQIAEEYLATHPVERGVFLIVVARAIAPVWGGDPLESWGAVQPGKETGLRQPLLLPHPEPAVGTHDDQNVRAPAVRGAGHPQRPRVRRRRGPGGRDPIRQGGQLLPPPRRPHRPGSDRRHLVAARDDRAPDPGL